MNDTQAFTFYRNYYEIIKYLPPKDRTQLYDAILEYMFEDKETQLDGLLNGIWVNLKRPLDTNKKNISNGKKGGRPKNEEKPKDNPDNNPKETQVKTQQKSKAKANNISNFLFIISNFKYNNNINNLLEEYINIRIKNKYIITESVINRLCNKLNEYGKTDEEKEQIILNAINGGWKDFYQLKENKDIIKTSNPFLNLMIEERKRKPEWFDDDKKPNIATKEEQQEIEDLLKEFE